MPPIASDLAHAARRNGAETDKEPLVRLDADPHLMGDCQRCHCENPRGKGGVTKEPCPHDAAPLVQGWVR